MKSSWMGLAFGIAALVSSILAIFVPVYGLHVSLVAIALAVLAALAGDRILSAATPLITAISLYFLSPIFWSVLRSSQISEQVVVVGGISLALVSPFVAIYLHATGMRGVNLVTGIIGIVMLMVFLGIMLWWVPALPLIVIVVGVLALMLYDFVQTLRYGENGGERS